MKINQIGTAPIKQIFYTFAYLETLSFAELETLPIAYTIEKDVTVTGNLPQVIVHTAEVIDHGINN